MKLTEWLKDLLGFGEENDYLDDDRECGALMNYILPGETVNRECAFDPASEQNVISPNVQK